MTRTLASGIKPSNASVSVVGGGIIGSWTALHLAEAGVKTTLVEQFPLPHTRGSSHGLSRAFRFLGELELDRLDYSLDRWLALEEQCGESLFVKTGLLNFGPPGDLDLGTFMSVLRDADRPVEWLDSNQIAQRFPATRYPEEWGAAMDPNGGILLAHRCLCAVQSRLQSLGGKIVTGQVGRVDDLHGNGVSLDVRSNDSGEIKKLCFDRAVICAGPWTAQLLPQLNGLLKSIRTPVTYWRDRSGQHSASNGFPILFNARLTGIYGLPSYEYPGLVKILYHGGPEADPGQRDQVSFEAEIDLVRKYVKAHLPGLDHDAPAILETCMYTMSPDGYPVIDRVSENLVVGCGFSGSGFKHAPATGQMLAALALGQDEVIPGAYRSERYELGRF